MTMTDYVNEQIEKLRAEISQRSPGSIDDVKAYIDAQLTTIEKKLSDELLTLMPTIEKMIDAWQNAVLVTIDKRLGDFTAAIKQPTQAVDPGFDAPNTRPAEEQAYVAKSVAERSEQ